MQAEPKRAQQNPVTWMINDCLLLQVAKIWDYLSPQQKLINKEIDT